MTVLKYEHLSEVKPLYLQKNLRVGLYAFPLLVFLTEGGDIINVVQGGRPTEDDLMGVDLSNCMVIEQE